MTQPPTVSVVIVSRDRPDELKRCLAGVSQLLYDCFEIIVVADAAGMNAIEQTGLKARIKTELFTTANISAARNAGLSLAAGRIVAFIDDDSVPEPTWLRFLVEPFSDSMVAAAGGFVRGRNGISYQWKASTVDPAGRSKPLPIDGSQVAVFTPRGARTVKTEGTNCAFRRDILAEIGGFDPAFRFYLDETDVNMRLTLAGYATAIVPRAEVHHGFARSRLRRTNRAPKDLFEIGASIAVFHRKYAARGDANLAWSTRVVTEKQRLLRHMVAGTLEPRDVTRLMRSLHAGHARGSDIVFESLASLPACQVGFLRFDNGGSERLSVLLSGPSWKRRALRQKARELVGHGDIVTLFLFGPTSMFHRVRFCKDGYWEQIGGLYGRSERAGPLIQLTSLTKRVAAEWNRVSRQRGSKEPNLPPVT